MRRIGNIKDFAVNPKKQEFEKNLASANAQAEQYRKEAEDASSLSGMAWNTVKGLPGAVGDIAKQTWNSPGRTAGAVATGLYEGAAKPILQMVTPKKYEGIYDIGMNSQNPTEEGIRQGFKFSGAVAPYSLATKGVQIASKAPAIAKMAPWLSKSTLAQNAIGNVVGGQILTDESGFAGRAKQASSDALLFGLTNIKGLRGALNDMSNRRRLASINQGQGTRILPSEGSLPPTPQDFGVVQRNAVQEGAGRFQGLDQAPIQKSTGLEISRTQFPQQEVSGKYTTNRSPSNFPTNGEFSYQGTVPNPQKIARDAERIFQGGNIKERGFVTSVKEGEKTPDILRKSLSGEYSVLSDQERIGNARKFIMENPDVAEQRAFNPTSYDDITIGNQLLDSYIANGQLEKVQALTDVMAKSGTDLGRAVKAFADYDKTTPSGAVKWAQSMINKYNKTNPKNPLSLSDGDVKSLMDKAHEVQSMPEGRARNIEAYKLSEQINNLIPSTVADKAITVWKAGLLTSFRTTLRNLAGNTIHGAAETIKDIPASFADMLMYAKTGKRTLVPTIKGMGTGAKEGLESAKDVWRSGYDPEEAMKSFNINRVTWGNNKTEKALKYVTDKVFRSLGSQDKPFWHSAYSRSLYSQSMAEAMNAGKAGDGAFVENLVKNATEKMKKTALQEANVATFKDENVIGKIASGIKQKARNVPGLGGEIGKVVTEVVMPFTGVPSSIAKQTLSYSPIGLAKGLYDAGKVLVKNMPELQRQASQEIGRGVVGTGLLGIGAYLRSIGIMTGQPKDANEALQWQMEGKQANSVLIGGKWRSVNSIGPEALIVLAGEKAQEEREKTTPDYGSLAGNLAKDQLSQTFLSGVQQPLQAINDPNRYASQYGKSMVASVIPNIVKDTAKSFDPYQREVNTLGESFLSGIPGARNSLLQKRDVLGNVLQNEQSGVSAFIDLLNSKTPSQNKSIQELSRLTNEGFDATPSKLRDSFNFAKQKIVLTPQELDAIEQNANENIMPILDKIVSSPGYQNLPEEQKQKLINNAIASVRSSVKKEGSIGKLQAREKAMQAIRSGDLGKLREAITEDPTINDPRVIEQLRKDAINGSLSTTDQKFREQLKSLRN